MPPNGYFGPDFFQYLAELRMNNDREWFNANKSRYESDLRDPLLAFIADFRERIGDVSSHYVAEPKASGGSMFRIYRDVRFARDKSPYHTDAWAHFWHEAGKKVPAPGFYLHLSTDDVFGGGGMWQPDSATLARIRTSIANNSSRWEKALKDTGLPLEGDTLKRPPKGYGADHPMIDYLKHKSFVMSSRLTHDQAASDEFVDLYVDACKKVSPMMKFLVESLGLPF